MKNILLSMVAFLLMANFAYSQEPPYTYFDFEDGVWDSFIPYAGMTWEGVVDNPDKTGVNTSDKVGSTLSGNKKFSGMSYFLESTIDFTESTVFTLDVYCANAGFVKLKLEDKDNKDINVVLEQEYTAAGSWATLTFDYIEPLNHTYSKMAFIIDSQSEVEGVQWYIDNLKGPNLSTSGNEALFTVVATNTTSTNFQIVLNNDGTKITMFDDGTNGDVAASDGTWTALVSGVEAGDLVYDVYVDDAIVSGGNNIAFTIVDSEDPIVVPSFEYDGSVVVSTYEGLFTVVATNTTSTNFQIELNNDGTKITMFDDGTNGDVTASDGTWSVLVSELVEGGYTYDVYVDDAIVSGGDDIAFTITESDDPTVVPSFNYDGAASAQTPFGDSPMTIPGKIEAENFDNGGEGVAFSIQTNPNVGTFDYRPEYTIVGIEQQLDGAVNIGFVAADEWLVYTVDVTAGNYDATIRYACGVVDAEDERGIKVFLDDLEVMDFDTSNVGGDWATFLTHTISNISLPESTGGILKVLWKTKGFNLDYIEFSTASSVKNTSELDSEAIRIFPNPFRNTARVAISLKEKSDIHIKVYDLTGQEIAVLHHGMMPAGDHELAWDGRIRSGDSANSGMYFIKVNVNGRVLTKKIIRQ